MTSGTVRRRYDTLAGIYDRITLDRLVYGAARRHAVELLDLRPGDTVLDVGCGTGLSLPLLREAVGPHGTVIGLDLSPKMLDRARERVDAHGWDNVQLLTGDATALRGTDLPGTAAPRAVLFALSLSTLLDPHRVLSAAAGLLEPAGRLLGDLGRHCSEIAVNWMWLVVPGGLVLWLRRRRTGARLRRTLPARLVGHRATDALDIARVLSGDAARLAGTDIADHALAARGTGRCGRWCCSAARAPRRPPTRDRNCSVSARSTEWIWWSPTMTAARGRPQNGGRRRPRRPAARRPPDGAGPLRVPRTGTAHPPAVPQHGGAGARRRHGLRRVPGRRHRGARGTGDQRPRLRGPSDPRPAVRRLDRQVPHESGRIDRVPGAYAVG